MCNWHCLITDQSKSLAWYLLSAMNYLSILHNQKLHFTQKLWIKIIFITIFFISDESDKLDNDAETTIVGYTWFCFKITKHSGSDRHTVGHALRDLEYASTEQQGTLLIMSLELNMTENDLILIIIVNLSTKF